MYVIWFDLVSPHAVAPTVRMTCHDILRKNMFLFTFCQTYFYQIIMQVWKPFMLYIFAKVFYLFIYVSITYLLVCDVELIKFNGNLATFEIYFDYCY